MQKVLYTYIYIPNWTLLYNKRCGRHQIVEGLEVLLLSVKISIGRVGVLLSQFRQKILALIQFMGPIKILAQKVSVCILIMSIGPKSIGLHTKNDQSKSTPRYHVVAN